MSRPRLLIISCSDIASDARVLKQVRLFADDYEVVTCGYGEQPDPRVRHVRLPDDVSFGRRGRLDMILRRYRRMYWTNSAIAAAASALRGEPVFDVILANDIETVGLALSLQPRAGVHADIHEYAPRQVEEVRMWRWFVAPYVRWMCRRFLRRAASVTTVGGGIAREYRRVYGVDAGVVMNAAPQHDLAPTPVGSTIRIVHSGAALRNRGIHLAMEAVAATPTDVSLDLFLMPNDEAYLDELRELADSSPRLTLHEPVPYAQLIDRLNGFDLGIHVIPPHNFNNRWALPNKFFDYVQARLGLIIGPSPEMLSILQEHRLGAAADGFEAADIARVLDSLDPETVATWKANADASSEALSAGAQVTGWKRAVDRLAGGATGAP